MNKKQREAQTKAAKQMLDAARWGWVLAQFEWQDMKNQLAKNPGNPFWVQRCHETFDNMAMCRRGLDAASDLYYSLEYGIETKIWK